MSKKKKPRPAPKKRPPSSVEGLRQVIRGAPTLPDIGAELRGLVTRLERVESYIIVCRMALDGQATGQDEEVARLLQRGVGDLLFEQIRDLENVAAKCDGGGRHVREDLLGA